MVSAPAAAIAVPMFGYRSHVGIDRAHGFVRRFEVTDAAAQDGAQPGAALDPANSAGAVRADIACCSAAAIEMPEKRGLKPRFQRPKPSGGTMPRFRIPRRPRISGFFEGPGWSKSVG